MAKTPFDWDSRPLEAVTNEGGPKDGGQACEDTPLREYGACAEEPGTDTSAPAALMRTDSRASAAARRVTEKAERGFL